MDFIGFMSFITSFRFMDFIGITLRMTFMGVRGTIFITDLFMDFMGAMLSDKGITWFETTVTSVENATGFVCRIDL